LALLIITEGSPTLGIGHIRRSITLAGALPRETRLWLLGRETRQNVPAQTADLFEGLNWEAGPVPQVATGDAVILDLECESQRAMWERCSREGVACLALDYFDPMHLPDMTINLMDHSGSMRAAYTAIGRAGDYHEGPDYALIRPNIVARRSLAQTATVRRVVVTMGGADPGRQTAEAARILRAKLEPGMEVTIILGPLVAEDLETEVRTLAGDRFRVVRNPSEFDDLLAGADVILTSGGTTLLEALCLGKPTVVFPQNVAETAHANLYVKAGACVWAESLPQVLSDAGLRQSLAAEAARRVDGRGVERIAAAAVELSKRALHS
jgi:spore coat polysaccharide biosynthesis predicted glycosyltransferase SpsG